MTDVKRLLDEATPLPWRDMAQGNSFLRDGTIVGQARLEGPRGTYNPEWVGWDEITRGHTEDARWTPTLHKADAALIVYAVNHLPDYEAAVDALEQIKTTEGKVCEQYEICEHVACQSSYAAWAIADAALRRLRGDA